MTTENKKLELAAIASLQPGDVFQYRCQELTVKRVERFGMQRFHDPCVIVTSDDVSFHFNYPTNTVPIVRRADEAKRRSLQLALVRNLEQQLATAERLCLGARERYRMFRDAMNENADLDHKWAREVERIARELEEARKPK